MKNNKLLFYVLSFTWGFAYDACRRGCRRSYAVALQEAGAVWLLYKV
jgi:hypothetical protein